MDYKVIAYGLTAEQTAHLNAALPDGCEGMTAACVTDVIVTDAACSIIDTTQITGEALNTLLAYYLDVGEMLDETVVWLGNAEIPELPSFVRCESFLDLLTGLNSTIFQAKTRYDTMHIYSSEYAFLPKHAIEESMETDVYAAFYRKYGENPDKRITKQVRREWQLVLETGAAEGLAAVYELTRWLKKYRYPFRVECTAVFPLILHLLGITDADLDSCADMDLLLQKGCLELSFTFYLPNGLQFEAEQWQKSHWMRRTIKNRRKALDCIRFIFNRII